MDTTRRGLFKAIGASVVGTALVSKTEHQKAPVKTFEFQHSAVATVSPVSWEEYLLDHEVKIYVTQEEFYEALSRGFKKRR